MSQTDPIGDMLAMMKNGAERQKEKVTLSYSRMKESVCQVLKEEGYIEDVRRTEEEGAGPKGRFLHIFLRYDEDRKPLIRGLRRVSRPGRKVYRGVETIGKVLDGLGVAILTTSKGVMSDRKARKERVGGEVICKVW